MNNIYQINTRTNLDITSEQTLVQRLAELQVKIQYLDSMYRSRQEDLQQLVQRVELATPPGPASASENASSSTLTAPAVVGGTDLRPEVRALLKNMSGMHAAHGVVLPPLHLLAEERRDIYYVSPGDGDEREVVADMVTNNRGSTVDEKPVRMGELLAETVWGYADYWEANQPFWK
nr:unnamed protein product [Callosobruchus chinensis]